MSPLKPAPYHDENCSVTVSLPTPRQAPRDDQGGAQTRRVAAEQARCQILLRLVTAKIEVLTAGVTRDNTDTWLSLRQVQGPPPSVDLDDLLREATDPDLTWAQIRRLSDLQDELRDYLHELGG